MHFIWAPGENSAYNTDVQYYSEIIFVKQNGVRLLRGKSPRGGPVRTRSVFTTRTAGNHAAHKRISRRVRTERHRFSNRPIIVVGEIHVYLGHRTAQKRIGFESNNDNNDPGN